MTQSAPNHDRSGRRRFLTLLTASATLAALPDGAVASRRGRRAGAGAEFNGARHLDARNLGLRADGGRRDQTHLLHAALRTAASHNAVLLLPEGTIRIRDLEWRGPLRLAGRPGTRLLAASRASFLIAVRDGPVHLTGVTLDGAGAGRRDAGLVSLEAVAEATIRECRILRAGGDGLRLQGCGGEVSRCEIEKVGGAALFSNDGRAMRIVDNHLRHCGDNGILVWQSRKRDDGALVSGNVIEDVRADSGGDGPYGNGVNVFRAGGVRVVDNRIRRCAFTAVRDNSGDACLIARNAIHDMGEVAIFVEFSFTGAVVSDNLIEKASAGISVTNMNEGGHLATVSGNIVRDVRKHIRSRDGLGYGIAVEADTAVTGNVVEDAANAGLALGWGPYLRDVSATGNVLRHCGTGIAVSVTKGAGAAVISGNIIAAAREGAIIGYDHDRVVTGDLARPGVHVPKHLTIVGNRSRP